MAEGRKLMVLAGKVFKLTEQLPLLDISSKMENYRTEETYEEGEHKFNLITEILYLTPRDEMLTGLYSHDYVAHIFHRGRTTPQPRTMETLFCFASNRDMTFLTVVEKKRVANNIANQLSKIIFGKIGDITEARIPPETLREFHLKNPEDTKITFFDNVDIPNIDKLSLYGPDLVGTSLFEDYCKHGDLWYIVARSREHGYVVGITRDACIVIFNETDKLKYLEYLRKEVYPLIL